LYKNVIFTVTHILVLSTDRHVPPVEKHRPQAQYVCFLYILKYAVLSLLGVFGPDDRSTKFLRNSGNCVPVDTA
jgi:hypothetical protein